MSPVTVSIATRSFLFGSCDWPAIFANPLLAKNTIFDNTPAPTYPHLLELFVFILPSKDDVFCPHSSSTAHINALPRLHLFLDFVGS